MDIPASIPEPGDVFDESPTSSIPAPTPEVGDVLDGSVAEMSESEPDRSTFDSNYAPYESDLGSDFSEEGGEEGEDRNVYTSAALSIEANFE